MADIDRTEITPRIGPVEPLVLEAKYQLPWKRERNQTACGKVIQRQNGDFNWRVVFSGVLTWSQLDALTALRSESGRVETRTAAFGTKTVVFDELSVTRADEESVGAVDDTPEPLYSFQLQTKELDDEDDGLFGE